MIYRCFCLISDGAFDFAGAQATGADIEALHLSVHYGANSLDVRLPAAFRLDMGMADIHTTHLPLVANLTNICHITHLLKTDDDFHTQYMSFYHRRCAFGKAFLRFLLRAQGGRALSVAAYLAKDVISC